ncbi:hypothetical protein LCGC14_1474010 [marine sediment metagenome]|uniref:Uncharacterized protein n=1 Tax=marine sediment metagenome TaxID=412755 RepID=A0A0F9JBH2_9ZZZZ
MKRIIRNLFGFVRSWSESDRRVGKSDRRWAGTDDRRWLAVGGRRGGGEGRRRGPRRKQQLSLVRTQKFAH